MPKLARQLSDSAGSVPDDVWQELEALGGAPQPAVASSVVASNTVRKLVEHVENLGYYPRQIRNPGGEHDQK